MSDETRVLREAVKALPITCIDGVNYVSRRDLLDALYETVTAGDGANDRDTLVAQQDQHRWIGAVNSRDHWSECECGARLPTVLDSDGYAIDDDAYNRVMAEHRADMLLASEWLAARDERIQTEAVAAFAAETVTAILNDPGLRLGHNVGRVCSCLRCEVANGAARIVRDRADRIGGAQ